jgi:hypothetical protein
MTDDAMTPRETEALAAAKKAADELRPETSRWDNAPGDIVILKRGGKDVNIPS